MGLGFTEGSQQGKRQRILPWWRTAPNGSLVFFVRLGAKPIEFDKGKSGIAVPSAEKFTHGGGLPRTAR
jgi:hypothetical protein